MTARPKATSLTGSVAEALEAPWELLRYNGEGNATVRAQARDNIEDAGNTEARVRSDYTGRYPIELLQNAHDACADAGREGAVRFAVTEGALLVANEGVPFTPERIRSLVRLGSSEKLVDRSERHTIGYKGVGFTAVFEITDRPQILGRYISFGFDRSRARREVRRVLKTPVEAVPARGFPFHLAEDAWREDIDEVARLFERGATTVIRLPFRATRDADKVLRSLEESIPRESLLFMPSIKELEVTARGSETTWTRSTGKAVGSGRLRYLHGSNGDSACWLVASASIKASRRDVAALADPLWQEVRELRFAAAIPWSKGPDPTTAAQPLHVYFPTEDRLGRALLVHGDFYVDSSRRHIETKEAGGAITRAVAKAVAKLAAGLAESIAIRGEPLLQCLAVSGDVSGFGETMGELLEAALRDVRIARPADGGVPKRPRRLWRLGMGSLRLERAILPLLIGASEVLVPGDDRGAAGVLLERLGCESFDPDDIATRIDLRHSSRSYAESHGVLGRWLKGLEHRDRRDVVAALRDRPIVREASGRWRRPHEVTIRRANAPELPSRIRRAVIEAPVSPAARALFRELGIPELTPDVAVEVVLDAIATESFGQCPAEAAQVLAFLLGAWELDRAAVTAQRKRLGLVRVPIRTARGRKRVGWEQARCVYFPEPWTGDRTLEAMYRSFRRAEFLAAAPPADANERRTLTTFYSQLGVASEARVLDLSGSSSNAWRWSPDVEGFSRWRDLSEVKEAFTCADGHPYTGRRVAFTVLDRLGSILASSDRETTRALLRYLSTSDSPYGRDAVVWCEGATHGGHAPRKHAIGLQRWLLETEPWVPVLNDPTGADARPPREAWVGAPRWLMVPQARLRADSAKRLQLVSADRPTVSALEHSLVSLSAGFPDLESSPADVQRSADWLAARLDRVLQRADGQASDVVPPLPSWRAGQRSWSASPVIDDVALSESPVLEEIDILKPGRWKGLRKGYALNLASETVRSEVERGKPIRAPRLLTMQRIAGLAALLAGAGANSERVSHRLARLKETAVEFVRVAYGVGDGPLSPPVERSHFLEVRHDKVGRSVIGASLYVTGERGEGVIMALGSDLAAYLGEPEHDSDISLFLLMPDAALGHHHVSEEEVEEAARRVATRRRDRSGEGAERMLTLEDLLGGADHFSGDAPPASDGASAHSEGETMAPGGTVVGNAPEPEPELPPLDHTQVVTHDIGPSQSSAGGAVSDSGDASSRGGTGRASGRGYGARRDWAQLASDQRLYGLRGEQAAYESERRRVFELGWDPDRVEWVSQADEMSPYDLRSVEANGEPRYIEVKSTTALEASEPFPISAAELEFAFNKRSRYFIYRVTDVRSASPEIFRYRDPLLAVESGQASLRTTGAMMALPQSPQ